MANLERIQTVLEDSHHAHDFAPGLTLGTGLRGEDQMFQIPENTLRNADGTPYQAGYDESKRLEELERLVFEALGEASLCWSERPKGVFDSAHANRIGTELMQAIKKYALQEAVKNGVIMYRGLSMQELDTMIDFYRMYRKGVMTINEVRQEMGLPPA